MQSALHITTKVLPGNKIEVEIPEAQIGDSVDVFVVLPEKVETKKRSVMEILEEVHAKRPPKSAEEIDRQLQEERESWD
jgi:antitoxin component of MazEF toxin-antitoxin module